MKYILLILMSLSWGAQAEEILPRHCKAIQANDETLKLISEKPSLFMIHNLSATDLWITHPVAESSASAGWTSRLQAGNWSALAVFDKQFELSCIESKPGHEQQVPCSGVVAVCQWESVTMPEQKVKSTGWAGEDMALKALTAYIGRMGYGVTTAAK